MLQALYHCVPFREQIIRRRRGLQPSTEQSLRDSSRITHTGTPSDATNSSHHSGIVGGWSRYIPVGLSWAGSTLSNSTLNEGAPVSDGQVAGDGRKVGRLLASLSDLFYSISSNLRHRSAVSTHDFMKVLGLENELFRGLRQQDAHEFLNYLLNNVAESATLEDERYRVSADNIENNVYKSPGSNERLSQARSIVDSGENQGGGRRSTWVHQLFQGVLSNETRCLCCESISSRQESFLDLSLEISPNCSLSSCLRQFSATETLRAGDKFFCDVCGALQVRHGRLCFCTTFLWFLTPTPTGLL